MGVEKTKGRLEGESILRLNSKAWVHKHGGEVHAHTSLVYTFRIFEDGRRKPAHKAVNGATVTSPKDPMTV